MQRSITARRVSGKPTYTLGRFHRFRAVEIIACRGSYNGVVGVVGRAAFFSRANILVRIVSTSLNAREMVWIASRQYTALARSKFRTRW